MKFRAMLAPSDASVGIIANPASGGDIRRLISAASGFSNADKCNIVRRLCLALKFTGVRSVALIPDNCGISGHVLGAKKNNQLVLEEDWPELHFLEMPITNSAEDTLCAVDLMLQMGVAAIIVLGGDGTHRLVASRCGDLPIVGLSTGTNNVFPEFMEATIAGLAAGLVASGLINGPEVLCRNKLLRLYVNGVPRDMALVDLCITSDEWVGSRALWHPEKILEIFVSFAEAGSIGLSSVAGFYRPISRRDPIGLRLLLCPPGEGLATVLAPIAPGIIAPMGIAEVQELQLNEDVPTRSPRGVVALDGEREFAFYEKDRLTVRLEAKGPLTIDVSQTMRLAIAEGLFSQTSWEGLQGCK